MKRPFFWTLLAGVILAPAAWASASSAHPLATRYPVIPAERETDLKFYEANGHVLQGAPALARMNQAQLVIWVAGNQFFAMDDVIHGFQQRHPHLKVGLLTLPPGLLKSAIVANGWSYRGKDYPGRPDLYATVSLEYLQDLKRANLVDRYATYMHNELQLMVAKGNPKQVKGIDDLGRADLRLSMPNAVNEGIMRFYGRPVLERHGLWQALTGGKECISCQPSPTTWFTAVHHRETPQRINDGVSDVGLVWKTEVQRAVEEGRTVEGVELPMGDSMRDEVSYVIAPLTGYPHPAATQDYLAYLASEPGQDAYAKHGFVRATGEELRIRPIPTP
jgi:ABC-type molybdate transport system substrate-binding protein